MNVVADYPVAFSANWPFVPILLNHHASPKPEGVFDQCLLAVMPCFSEHWLRWVPQTN